MRIKTRLLIVFLTLPFTFAMFAFWGSVKDVNLEQYSIEKSKTHVTSVERYQYGKAGLVVATEDRNGKGEVFVLVRLVPSDRYQLTKSFNHNQNVTEKFAGLDFYNSFALSLDNQKFEVQGEAEGIGYLWVLFYKFLAGLMLSAALIPIIQLIIIRIGHKESIKE